MIHIYENNYKTKVLIKDIYENSYYDILVKAISKYNHVDISFIDVDFLDKQIVLYLYQMQHKVSLKTNDKTLWIYLRRLGMSIKLDTLHAQNKILELHTLKAIAIGGSAGSLSSMVHIIKNLPYSDISVFIVMHILPDKPSKLVEILQQHTNYKVEEPKNAQAVKMGHIYIAKPDLHMEVSNGKVFNLSTPSVNFCRPSIDVLFSSLAKEYHGFLVTILTCGYLDDGSRALSDVKKYHGTSIVQTPNECEANEMPLNALMTRNYDHMFKLEEISNYLQEKLNTVIDIKKRLQSFMKHIDEVYGYDFSHYDMQSLVRRIDLLRQELSIDSFSEFESIILHDKEMFELMFKKLSINVSEFFRDPEVFKNLRKEVIPILNSYPHIRVWSSACSKGEEPYSIAMLLDEFELLDKSIIYATDFNPLIIKQAKNGLFTSNDFEICKANYLQMGGKKDLNKWFETYESFVSLKTNITSKVQFFQHNLATDGEINEFHIIFCRNVLIYFDKELQRRVLELIYTSLVRGGFLIIGGSEYIELPEMFKKISTQKGCKIFKKIGGC